MKRTIIEEMELSDGKTITLFKVSGQYTGRKQYIVMVSNPQGAPDVFSNLLKGEAEQIYTDILKEDLVTN